MSFRRRELLAGLDPYSRRDCTLKLVQTLEAKLLQRYPREQGFLHTPSSDTAKCIDRKTAPPEVQKEVQTSLLNIARGPWWGLGVKVEPLNAVFGTIRIVVREALPAMDKARGVVFGIAGVLGLIAGIIAVIVGLVQHESRPIGTGMFVGIAVFIALSFAGLLLLVPFGRLAALKLNPEMGELETLVDQALLDLERERSLSGTRSSPGSPTFRFFLGLLGSLIAGGGCYWATRQPWSFEGGAHVAVWIAVLVFGVTAFCSAVGFIAYALELFD